MRGNLIAANQTSRLVVRCQCGKIVVAKDKGGLVERVRLHFSEFHPNLRVAVPADLIMAMAEE
jgi:hypothetical protein